MTGAVPTGQIGPELLAAAEEISDRLIAWRREFHQFPELAFEENVTSARIVETLSSIEGVEVVKGFGCPTSVIGVIGGDLPGKTLMIRAEMDALALDEETGVPFPRASPASCMRRDMMPTWPRCWARRFCLPTGEENSGGPSRSFSNRQRREREGRGRSSRRD